MTPKELYDWAVENDCENYDIMVCQDKARIWEVVDCADVSVDTLSQTVDLKLNR